MTRFIYCANFSSYQRRCLTPSVGKSTNVGTILAIVRIHGCYNIGYLRFAPSRRRKNKIWLIGVSSNGKRSMFVMKSQQKPTSLSPPPSTYSCVLRGKVSALSKKARSYVMDSNGNKTRDNVWLGLGIPCTTDRPSTRQKP